MDINEEQIRSIVQTVVKRLTGDEKAIRQESVGPALPQISAGDGIFDRLEDAIAAAETAHEELISLSLNKREEIIDYPHMDFCGVAKFLEEAQSSKVQLFI